MSRQLPATFQAVQGGGRSSTAATDILPPPPLQTPPSFALLRQGVSPGDPHLIAPALGEGTDDLISPFYPPVQLAAGQPTHKQMRAQGGQQQLAELAGLKKRLCGLNGQLEAVRVQANGWQKMTADVGSLEGQMSLLRDGMAGLEAAQARLQQSSYNTQRNTQQQLLSLGRRMEGLADNEAARGVDEALAPLSARLQQAEQALGHLSGRVQNMQGEVQQAGPLAEADAWNPAAASLREELQELCSSQGATSERQDAQALQLAQVAKTLQIVQASVSAAAKQHATQLCEFGSQRAEIARMKSKAEVEAELVQRLTAQLADVSRHLEQLASVSAHGAGAPEIAALQERVESNAVAVEQLQTRSLQVATVQEAVDDANQRLFELRVEALNATEASAILSRSAKGQVRLLLPPAAGWPNSL